MLYIPFIGRLQLREYVALVFSVVLIFLESLIAIITLALPGPVLRVLYRSSRSAFNLLSSPQGRKSRSKKKALVTSIAQASDFVELCELFGYYAEEHIVQTGDGYFLGLHRLGWKRGEEHMTVNSGRNSIRKKVVYLHHGLMMNSDVWVCISEKERCLPFMLVEQGYDVWLGNNRGNKYSKKSVHRPPTEIGFWNFSMDEFAFHDIPDSIEYVLSTTAAQSLSYIGFSQGTAQAFATLSIHPTLNEKVDVFIALAPAMSPKGLTNGIVDSFVKASPEVLFLAFGRRAILRSAIMWQAILYPPIFVRFIDMSLSFLFGWTGQNITPHQKLAAYPHLYSFTSTKSVVHWFQIIRNAKFQMYDDEVQKPLFFNSSSSKYYKVAKYPTRNIKTPIVLVYGGSDSLVDINVMLKELPRHTIAEEIPHYEHLDFLWASSVDTLVFPHVIKALDTYMDPERKDGNGNSGYLGYSFVPDTEGNCLSNLTDEDEIPSSANSPAASRIKKVSESVPHPVKTGEVSPETPASDKEQQLSNQAQHTRRSLSPIASGPSQDTNRTTSSRPEGWWSSDDAGIGGEGKESGTPVRNRSRTSLNILDKDFSNNGISLGKGGAIVGGPSPGEVGDGLMIGKRGKRKIRRRRESEAA